MAWSARKRWTPRLGRLALSGGRGRHFFFSDWWEQIALLAALRPHERVLVLLQLLGGERPVGPARNAIEAFE